MEDDKTYLPYVSQKDYKISDLHNLLNTEKLRFQLADDYFPSTLLREKQEHSKGKLKGQENPVPAILFLLKDLRYVCLEMFRCTILKCRHLRISIICFSPLAINLLYLCRIFNPLQNKVLCKYDLFFFTKLQGGKGDYLASTTPLKRWIYQTKRFTKEFQQVSVNLAALLIVINILGLIKTCWQNAPRRWHCLHYCQRRTAVYPCYIQSCRILTETLTNLRQTSAV